MRQRNSHETLALTVANGLQTDAFDQEPRGSKHGGQRRHARMLLLPPLQAVGRRRLQRPLAVVQSLAGGWQQRLLRQ